MNIYDAIGGTPVVNTAVTILYDRVTADPLLSKWFDGIDLRTLKIHQRDFLMVALGGPDDFRGRSMHEAHASLAITNGAFTAILDHLGATLGDLGIADEGVAAIVDRVERQREAIVDPAADGASE